MGAKKKMNVRFSEPCRHQPLELLGAEKDISSVNYLDGRTQKELALACQKDIFIGVFFDGTNNNKYRDTPGFAHSNVARLYEVYPGTNATQTSPTLLPKVKPNGGKEARPVFADKSFKSPSVPADDHPYYRKIYVPGLGTPLPDVRDTGTGLQKAGGLATALLGQARLDWALLQLVNQVHAAVFKTPLQATVDLGQLYQRKATERQMPAWMMALGIQGLVANMAQQQLKKAWDSYAQTTGTYDSTAFNRLLNSYVQKLSAALKARGTNKPDLRKIRLSVFGFSRGAAEARAWVNMLSNRWGGALAGIPLQIDFLGIFDTVASVGLAHSTPPVLGQQFDGHGAWAEGQNMVVPPHVKRCVHLVAAFEIRGSFPLDSICQGGVLPANCKEIVYPGVHSDVGGGYPPDDQGRALGGAQGDPLKPSQIALAQMYREARMAGVPLAPPNAMFDYQKTNFAISPKLREDFNAYVAATRTGSVPPTQGKGQQAFASMFPTETQPRGELHRVMRHHYGFLLRWRKAQMNRPGGASAMPGLMASPSVSKYQDIEDIRGAEQELRKEIIFLESKDPKKFDVIDDTFFDKVFSRASIVSNVAGVSRIPPAQLLALSSTALTWDLKSALRAVMQEKQQQWDTWLHAEWASHSANALPAAAAHWFEHYVHDSRAWFKPFMRSDVESMVPDDEAWFVFGEREKDLKIQMKAAEDRIADARDSGEKKALAEAEKTLQRLKQDGQPLLMGGREPYRLWGYVRHRRIFQAGQLNDPGYRSRQAAIEREEEDRVRERARIDRIAKENARHEEKMRSLMARDAEVRADSRLPSPKKDEFTEGTRAQIAREKREHAESIAQIERTSATSK
ncbi:T6SS phospholipase effector Tle1-like catalytic domain-containing protein [Aquabacterium sp.]|uniref:T6SS phospholipase effector Tle1-like catalytic domain-containing protein n=1 Tax=Aquabacterium sp. TaxID=1872578 RepID=UPI003D0293B7